MSLAAYLQKHCYQIEDADSARHATIVAFCNGGYARYTLNLLESMRRCGVPQSAISLFATDEEAEKQLTEAGYEPYHFKELRTPNLQPPSAIERWTQKGGNWPRIVVAKLEVVHAVLSLGYDVLYTDGDVVWKMDAREPVAQFMRQHEKVQMAFMSDETWNRQLCNYCTGFFYIRATRECIEVWDPLGIDWKTFTNDQPYINRKIRSWGERVASLDKKKFPNGNRWQKYASDPQFAQDAIVVHFNYLIGERKRDTMIQYNMWYV